MVGGFGLKVGLRGGRGPREKEESQDIGRE